MAWMCRAMAPRRQTCVRMSTGMPKIKAQKKALEVARRRTPQQGGGAAAGRGTERRRGAPQGTGRAPSPAAHQPPLICLGGDCAPKWVEDLTLWLHAAIAIGGPWNDDDFPDYSSLAGLLDPEECWTWTAECETQIRMVEQFTGVRFPLSEEEEIELDGSGPTVSESASSCFS